MNRYPDQNQTMIYYVTTVLGRRPKELRDSRLYMGQRMNCLVNYPLTHLSVGLSFSLSVGLSVSLPIYRLLASLSSCLRLLTGRSVCLLADRLIAICL